ncbi:MAG: M23 family metallopeptidase [Omnitrophica WOR_2 bacterium]|jgi:murein DD-endopeptidase MepM/ murein hydrolase activator NlpD
MASRKNKNEFQEKKVRWYQKLRDKYRLVILNEDTFEEKLSFRLSRMNVFVVLGMLAIILIFLTTYLIAFTPLKEYIPGYNDTNVQEELYEMQLKTDSLEKAFKDKDLYITNMRKVLKDETDYGIAGTPSPDTSGYAKYANITLKKSKEDSLLRADYEKNNRYNLTAGADAGKKATRAVGIPGFFPPIKGIVTSKFNASAKHFGVDVVARKNEAIKAVYDGVVIFSEWSSETGHVIAIQHTNNVVSVYKHNSVLLRKQGAYVRAGESIAIIGESGEYTTGPHLHFELWINGSPVNPEDFIIF